KPTIDLALHGMLDPTLDELAKATEARRAGQYDAWVSHLLRSIPVVGQAGVQAGELAERGDWAGAIGRTGGFAGQLLAPKVFGKVAKTKTGPALTPPTRARRTGCGRLSAVSLAATAGAATGGGRGSESRQ